MSILTHGELFAGISGFGAGFARAGIETVWHVELDGNCQKVLRRHYPDTLLLSDVREVGAHNLPRVDIISFGSPCQDLSIAGKREGLAGERSGLFFEAIRVVRELRPALAVWENVPGAFSSNAGRDFAAVLSAFRECGARDIAWRVLDAQYTGVAQRRRRVFVVASFGDDDRAAEILFEPASVSWHPPARGKAGQGVAATATPLTASGRGSERAGESRGQDTVIPEPRTFDWQAGVAAGKDRAEIMNRSGRTRSLTKSWTLAVVTYNTQLANTKSNQAGKFYEEYTPSLTGNSPVPAVAYNIQQNDGGEHRRPDRPEGGLCVNETETALTVGSTDMTVVFNELTTGGRLDGESETFVFEPRIARNGRGAPDTIAPPLKAQNGQSGKGDGAPVVAFQSSQSGVREVEQHATLDGHNGSRRQNGVMQPSGVRRLTPTECERLQGFPDGWTQFGLVEAPPKYVRECAAKGKEPEAFVLERLTDSARYRMLGNAVCVNVAEWLGRRIMATERGDGHGSDA